MSAKRPPPMVDDRERREIDPHGIIPEGFVESWGAKSVAEALRIAEEAPSSTPAHELPKCPQCGSQKIHRKHGKREIATRREEDYKCSECLEHFEKPVYEREQNHSLDEFF